MLGCLLRVTVCEIYANDKIYLFTSIRGALCACISMFSFIFALFLVFFPLPAHAFFSSISSSIRGNYCNFTCAPKTFHTGTQTFPLYPTCVGSHQTFTNKILQKHIFKQTYLPNGTGIIHDNYNTHWLHKQTKTQAGRRARSDRRSDVW